MKWAWSILCLAALAVTDFAQAQPTDVGNVNIQKLITYDQSSFTTPVLDPDNPYRFQLNINTGITAELLPTSVVTPPAGSTQAIALQTGVNGLNFDSDFTTQPTLDAGFANGTYNATIKTTTPNTYSISFSLTGNSYPPIPQLASVTSGGTPVSFVNGVLQVADPSQDLVFTWNSGFSSGNGGIFFQVNNSPIGQSFPVTATTFTIPGGNLSNNSRYQGSLNFSNFSSTANAANIPEGSQYSTQVQFIIQVGTPVVTPPTINAIQKKHVLVQTSTGAPVNGSGDPDFSDPAPYSFKIQNAASGTVIGPANLTLAFDAGDNSNNAPFHFSSGSIANQTTLDASFADGNYTLPDGHVMALTGDSYPNVPQITQVNGATPTWNAQGQLVLDPSINNILTWTSFTVAAGTFAASGYEQATVQSTNDSAVDIEQKSGFPEASTVTFNTLTIPANTMQSNFTYEGNVSYLLGSSVVSPSTNVYDFAGYATENFFTVLAQASGSAAQTINFAALNPNQVVNTNVTLIATATSGLPVSFTVVSGPASLSGNTLTFTGIGSVTVRADQSGNSAFAAAPSVSQTLNVNTSASGGQPQTIDFPSIGDQQNAGLPVTLSATSSSGLPVIFSVASGPATINGNVVTFFGTSGGVTINADQPGNGAFAAAPTASISFELIPPPEVNFIDIQKTQNFSQSSPSAPVPHPEEPFQFNCNINAGSTGHLLSTSTFTAPGKSPLTYQSGFNGLNFNENFVTKAAMDAAFGTGAYGIAIQTDTPNTYTASISLPGDNYPGVTPQITGVTWGSDGHMLVTNVAQPVVFTWPAFNSAVGTIFFNISDSSGNEIASQSFPADGTQTSFTLPGSALTAGQLYQASLSFQNSTNSTPLAGVSGSASYQNQVQFIIEAGTVAPPTATLCGVNKGQVMVQTSSAAPVPAAFGDIVDKAPYNFSSQSPVSGSIIAPGSVNHALAFEPDESDGDGQYRYTSGAIASLATLNSTYPDGNYTLPDNNVVALTGDVYTNVPQVLQVNGAPPIWNAQGQLVLDPSIDNTITWAAINQVATTFATNGHEQAQFSSFDDTTTLFNQKTGVGESSNAPFNTALIPANSMTVTHTYVGSIDYFLAATVNSAGVNAFDFAGYDMENTFTILAQSLPPALNPTFNSSTDVGLISNGYIATNSALTINLNFAPVSATTLMVINNTSATPIVGTFSNVTEGGTISASFGGNTYTFTATYHGGDGNDMTLTYTPPLPPSSLTILHLFADGSVANDGTNPASNLIQGSDGNFYGTARNGGSDDDGAVFRITARGEVTILHSFNDGSVPNDGEFPQAALIQASDGNFYGVTQNGGIAGQGSVYKITTQGTVTILHSFGDNSVLNDGQNPQNSLVQASDGNLYGTTSGGGSAGVGAVFEITLQGQVTILHSFNDGSVANDGTRPESPLIQASDGNFYGTTNAGGSAGNGTIYKITPLGQVTLLHSYGDGSVANDGANPSQGLIQGPDGNFYGTANVGGFSNEGIAYKITPQGQLTILHQFNDGSVLNDGQLPSSSLILGLDGNFYGVTQNGGSNPSTQTLGTGDGTIYRITPQGVVTVLHSFSDGSVINDGQAPLASLVQGSDGTLYGTTFNGGAATGSGIIFKFSPGLPVITSPLNASGTVGLSFSYQTTATNTPTSYSAMGLPDGLAINPATGLITGTPTTDGQFSVVITASNAKGPSSAPLTITIATLPVPVVTSILSAYGTVGTPFNYATVATNNPTSYAASGLPNTLTIFPSSGVISGTPTTTGTYSVSLTATNNVGTSTPITLVIQIFGSAPLASQEYNIIHRFGDTSDPNAIGNDAAGPGAIFQGFDGTFYGVSTGGGAGSNGAAFNITNQGNTTVLHPFGTSTFPDGITPQSLIQAADGSFYGTSSSGGTAGFGTVFKFTQLGAETILHSFGDGSVTNDGAVPQTAGLVQGTDGNFYGTTQSGGSSGHGTVYKITPLGAITILHSFSDGPGDGSSPQASLIQGSDGNFYGTTRLGGAHNTGTVFKMTSLGVVTILHSFSDVNVINDGANPVAALVQGFDATNNVNFYGTTQSGGAHGTGTVFQITSGGGVTILHSFGDGTVMNDGAQPLAPLIQGDDRNFYGTTSLGGSANQGTVFAITASGTETLIHQFGTGVTNDGATPTSALYQDTSGNFYGTTSSGGVGNGAVFTFVTTILPNSQKPVFTGATSVSSPSLTPFSFTPTAYFEVPSNNSTTATVQPGFVTQLIHKLFSQTTNWSLQGTLPQFLVFDSTSGTISGTPIQAGVYTITLTANNAAGTGAPQTVTLFIDVAPAITSATTVTGTVGTPFTYQIVGNASPTSYGATGLPGWLSVDTTTGIISGTPPGAGTYIFSPTASNVSGTGTQQVTLTVSSNIASVPSITSSTAASATVGTAFTYQIAATNAPASYSAVTLPAGLLFDSTTGIISGTPTTDGTYLIPIGATNASGTTSSVLTLTVAAVTAPVITSCSAITCTPSSVISYQITGTSSPTSFSAQGLPAGLSLDPSTGIITGQTANLGASTVALSATNNVGTGTALLALNVTQSAPVPTLTSPSTATSAATLPFDYQTQATNNPTSFDASGLPPGLTINPSTGEITGTPTTTGTYNVTLYITNSTTGTSTAALTLTFSGPTYNQWATLYPNAVSPTATPEKDGVPNLLKYLFGINPTVAMSASDRAALPVLGTTKINGTNYLTLTYRQYSLETGLSVNVLSSSDLRTWSSASNATITPMGTDTASGDMVMQARVPQTGGKQFITLQVVAP